MAKSKATRKDLADEVIAATPQSKPLPIPGERTDDAVYLSLTAQGTSGLKESGGWIYEEFLPQLQGSKGVRLYAEMDKNSAAIGAIRMLVRDLVRQVEWTVEPNERAKDQQKAKREAEFIEGCLGDMEHSWESLISEALTMIEFGFAPCEITYKLRRGSDQPPEFESKFSDGRFGWRSIELRAQETLDKWEFDPATRKLKGMWQQDMYAMPVKGRSSNVFLPIERLVNFRTESTKNNPEGRSLFRNAVVPYMRLKHIETIEMIGLERELTGMPIMEVPLNILAVNQKDPQALAVRADLERQLGSLKTHERSYMIVPAEMSPSNTPTGWKFRLQQSPGTGRIDVSKSKLDYQTQIFISCLAQFLLLGQNGNGGARALSEDSTDLFSLIMFALLESIREAFQREAIDRLCRLNCVEADYIPKLKFGDIDNPNLQKIGSFLTALNTSGILVPDEQLREHLYKIAGLPFAKEGDDVVPADDLIARALGNGSLEGIGQGTGSGSSGSSGGSSSSGLDEPKVELLNGAQLASLVQVLDAMSSGTLPRESVFNILTSTLGMEPRVVDAILDPLEEKLNTMGPTQPGQMQPGQGRPGMPGGQGAGKPSPTQNLAPEHVVPADQLVDNPDSHPVTTGVAQQPAPGDQQPPPPKGP